MLAETQVEWAPEMDRALLHLIQKQGAWGETMSICGGKSSFRPNKIFKLAQIDPLGHPLRWSDESIVGRYMRESTQCITGVPGFK